MNDHSPDNDDPVSGFASARGNPTRRGFLRLSALFGLFVATPGLVSAASATTKKKAVKKTSATPTTKKPTTAAAPSTTVTTKKPSAALAGGTFDESKELVVTFTFAASDGFRVRNPYVAVWLEDSAGNLVRTIDLSYQTGRGEQYLEYLKRWLRSDQARTAAGGPDVAQTISGPTRMPGTYSATWDGRDENGTLMKQGTYTVYVEAAREHGPYEVVSDAVTVGSATFTKKFADSGELSNVSVQLKARA
jgi:hypothetical protein